jgi:hypothetical protein
MTGIAHDMFRLDGKVAVVTGGGRGIGVAVIPVDGGVSVIR